MIDPEGYVQDLLGVMKRGALLLLLDHKLDFLRGRGAALAGWMVRHPLQWQMVCLQAAGAASSTAAADA